MTDRPKAYTVTAITRMVKNTLEGSYHGLWVEGEISNYLHHSSGHRYFALKDDNAVLKVTLWKSVGGRLEFEPENGQKVLAYGDITVYEKGGVYQLNCRKLLPSGIGPLELAFRQLHEKLTREGLFAPELKQELPRFPNRIGVVTSPTGAAIRDIIQIATRRNDSVELIIFPAQVQGEGAEETIAAGIAFFNSRRDIDLIITGRGGGSLEDLWPFNTEVTVRAIVGSRIPVISAVGHEIDTTLSDLAADMRAPTPSAAAELAVWSKADMKRDLEELVAGQTHRLRSMLSDARGRIQSLVSRPVFARPMEMIRQPQQYLDGVVRVLQAAGKNRFDVHKNNLSLLASRLEALSPLGVLARGYSVSRKIPKRKLVRSAADILPGDRMETILSDGRIVSFVEHVEHKKKG